MPATQITIRGLEYYTVVQSGDLSRNIGSPDEPYEIVVEFNNAQGQRPSAMPNGSYRIIGLPVIYSHSASMASIFEDNLGAPDETKWRLGRYETVDDTTYEYPDLSMITPGKGYWLAARNNKRYGSAGTSVRAEEPYNGDMYYLVPLELGWNMIANPYAYNIDWNDVIFDDNGTITENHDVSILDDVLHQYNGSGYAPNSALPAWGGAFVYIKKAGVTAMFLNKENSNIFKLAPKENSYGRDNWAVNLILETPHIVDDYNMAGVRTEAYDGADDYDFAEPPPAPDGASIAFKLEDDDLLRCTDFRPRFSEGAVWEIRLINCKSGKIMATNLNQIPEGMSARIIVGDRAVRLEDQNEIAIYQSDNNAYLLIGTEKYLNHQESELLPITFSLEQNYPNPFNPRTSIRFALPNNGFTTLEIYNVLGQKVKTLLEKELPAGFYTVSWNGDDNNGNDAASGVYFYRLISADKSAYKKMLLIK
ncbi:MAG: T9SS type A sorting domain-containing protein [candidate division Zixibacteria bacterium]|nr:T9SS type A sorting domain-containing protein [candidate division Zixibacteria bacterium]